MRVLDYEHKEKLNFISAFRLPNFVTKADIDWAIGETTKKIDLSKIEFMTYGEGECVQCMHIGSCNNEPSTLGAITK